MSETTPGESSVAVDARWIRHTGIGRVTRLFLEGLQVIAPRGRWTLWGPDGVDAYTWDQARLVRETRNPLAIAGQAALFSMPPSDLAISLHAVRPLSLWRKTGIILHDVIPALYAPSAVARAAWRSFLTISARSASRVLVYSDATERRAVEMLAVHPERIRRVSLGPDSALVNAILAARDATPSSHLLYVGQFKSHKNLRRALRGFAQSGFAADDGKLKMVISSDAGAEGARRLIDEEQVAGATVLTGVGDDELARLYGAAAAVVMPSLEEGLGLPIMEARAAGVPVCCSDIPAHREASAGEAVFFEPYSEESISAAIDEVVTHPVIGRLSDFTSPRVFAGQVLDAFDLGHAD